jgi:hypothetical protein
MLNHSRTPLFCILIASILHFAATANALTINLIAPNAGETEQYRFQISNFINPRTLVTATLNVEADFTCVQTLNQFPPTCASQFYVANVGPIGTFLNTESFIIPEFGGGSASGCNVPVSSCQKYQIPAKYSALLQPSTELFQFSASILGNSVKNVSLTLFIADDNAQVVQLSGPGTLTTADVPLPAGAVLLISGLIGLVGMAKRSRRS